MKYCKDYQNVMQKHEVSKCCWENGIDRLAQLRVGHKPSICENAISTKCNKMRYACTSLFSHNPLFLKWFSWKKIAPYIVLEIAIITMSRLYYFLSCSLLFTECHYLPRWGHSCVFVDIPHFITAQLLLQGSPISA